MKSSFGNNLHISLFGESHSEAIGIVADGFPSGIQLDWEFIQKQLDKRKPKGKISTARHEADDFKIVSGYFNGYTTGTPLCIFIPNQSQNSSDYEATKALMRPSHADYTAQEKYLGYQDYRGGGHFSGRLTAPIVACGAICLQILKQHNIIVGTHIKSCFGVEDSEFSKDETILSNEINRLDDMYFPVLNQDISAKIQSEIENAAKQGDSVGGILESAVLNMPTGVGEPFFHSIESTLSHLLFSVPAVKGVEFGLGFSFADKNGSEANDKFYFNENMEVKTKTNFNGGINGGISNGMPIIIKTVIKPTPSIFQEQDTIDINQEINTKLTIKGRHDPAIIHRARVVVDSVIAIGLVDLLISRNEILYK